MSHSAQAGTPLAQPQSVDVSPAVPPFVALRSANLRTVGSEVVRKRAPLFIGYAAVILGLLWAAGYSWRRLGALAVVYALGMGYQIHVGRRTCHRNVLEPRDLFFSHLAAITAQAAVFGLTGGLSSPLLPGIIGPSIGTTLAFGRSRESRITVAYVVAVTLLLALAPRSITGDAPPYPYGIALAVCAVTFSVVLLYNGIVRLCESYVRAGETLERMREDVCAGSIARTKSLEAIGSKVAHELKNPLAAIKGLVQLLERNAGDVKSRERLGVIGDEVTRMEAILKDYLSFSRPLEELRPERISIGDLVDDVLAVLEARAELARVELARRGEGVTVVGDARRLKEALINLVTNAIEATPPEGRVTVDVRAVSEGAEIVVEDTGRGIPSEQLARIGTPFFTTREGGTGLGVVLARAVVQHHGGEIRYDSTAGRGTTVTVTLPSKPTCRGSNGEAAVGG